MRRDRRPARASKPAPPASAGARPSDARAGRVRARLLLLAVLALLAGTLAPFAAAPADAQTVVWSATLTVQSATGNGCNNAHQGSGTQCSVAATLTDDDFTYGGTTYTFRSILDAPSHKNTAMVVSFSGLTGTQAKTALTGLTFNAGTSTSYAIADATAESNELEWSVIGWSVGDTVSLSLTAPTTTDATLSNLTASTSSSSTGTFSALTLTPSTFSASTTSYTATVPNTVTHLKLTPTVNNASATVKVGKGTNLATVASGSPSGAIPLSVGSNAVNVEVTAADGTTKKTYTVTVTRQTAVPTLSLSASPNPVGEGSAVTVTVTLSRTLSTTVTIPLTVTARSAESGDYSVSVAPFLIHAGSLSVSGTLVTTNQDADEDDETFTVALGSSLPSGVTAGSPSSVLVRISDDDNPFDLSVEATPACGTTVADTSVEALTRLVLTPAPATEMATDIRPINAVGTGLEEWQGNANISTDGRTHVVTHATLADLRRAFPGFTGFEFRLRDTPGVAAHCTWQFADDGGTDPPPDGGGPPPGGGGPPPGGGGPPPDDDDDDDDGDGGGGPPPDDDDDDDGDGGGGPPSAAIETDAGCEAGLCRARTGAAVSFRDASTGTVSSRLWDFDDGGRSRSAAPSRSWASPGFYEVTLSVSDGTVDSKASLVFLVEAGEPAGTCVADDETRCLRDSRFTVEMDWWTGEDRGGPGKVVREGTNGSALFHFFEPGDNWEVLIKVLDGCSVNEHVWVYGASATTLGYAIRVTDTVTGVVREYMNEDGRRADAIADSEAFAGVCGDGSAATASEPSTAAVASSSVTTPAAAVASSPLAGGAALLHPAAPVAVEAASGEGACVESATTMCLLDGRYEVSTSWSAPPAAGAESGDTGPGRVARARTPDSGLFYFFDPENWEMLVKVLDACAGYGHHWVFAASATDLGLDLVVRDTVTGEVRNYVRDPGEPSPAVADVSAFPNGCRSD